ncbi:protein kinase domain-containing protein [Stieleria varia]|uniref:Serine/threonine-protein kinase PknB n=1 Tax=Stieleria varia TaxID=2528005 RepID=A0A5C6B8J9_9BACT|nr:protein kinase [Stieleria varia]TWU08290.1 Serine/threonine-protein kinase PknB [Stieleria varia]
MNFEANPSEQDVAEHELLAEAPSWYGDAETQGSNGVQKFQESLGDSSASPVVRPVVRPVRLGKYTIGQCVGSGGMGTVYRGTDDAGQVVAVKVLRADVAQRADASERFAKEARILARSTHASIARLHEVGDESGVRFIVTDFVDGLSLKQMLEIHAPLPERLSLQLVSLLLMGLDELHQLGIVHRDIKPANIMIASTLLDRQCDADPRDWPDVVIGDVKLTDFGLAREIDQSESQDLTRTHALLGTPQYMAPEQCLHGDRIDASADIYSMGATLYEMLSGHSPLQSNSFIELIEKHRHEKPASLSSVCPSISEPVSRLVTRTLEKNPLDRFADAAELLAEIQRILDGQPTGTNELTTIESREYADVREYEIRCELNSSAEALWPFVSNTDRINRATHLPPANFEFQRGVDGELRLHASLRFLGMRLCWTEHPYEWIEAKRMSVLRKLSKGPLQWVLSTVDLTPRSDGGTTLVHRIEVKPRGLLGIAFADFQVGRRSVKEFERVYRRIDTIVGASQQQAYRYDAFEPSKNLGNEKSRQLDESISQLGARGVDANIMLLFSDFLSHAAPQEVARIRPFELAERWGVSRTKVIDACLHAAHVGLLILRWDIHCPHCRVPTSQVDTLRDVQSHGRCDVCDAEFRCDAAHDVELVFCVNHSIRDVETKTYCVGGPFHLPHVVAQRRLESLQQDEITMSLCEGDYRISSPMLPKSVSLRVRSDAKQHRCRVELSERFGGEWIELSDEGQRVTIVNRFSRELLVRIERNSESKTVLTAAYVTSLALFRELFPREILSVDVPALIDQITFMVCEILLDHSAVDDSIARTYASVHQYLNRLPGSVSALGGVCVKSLGRTIVCVFHDQPSALAAGDCLLADTQDSLQLRIAIHSGSAVLATVAERLEYFGETLDRALDFCRSVPAGEVRVLESMEPDLS